MKFMHINKSSLYLILLIIISSNSFGVPALLPNKNEVPAQRALAIDGVWNIPLLNKRIQIDRGRAYALDPWVHLFLFEISPDMVVLQDLQADNEIGKFSGFDLPLAGKWKAEIQSNRHLKIHVAGALGPVSFHLTPINLADPQWFDEEMNQMGIVPPTPIEDPIFEIPGPIPGLNPPIFIPPKEDPYPMYIAGDITKNCGGEGQIPCKYAKAKVVGKSKKLGCPGKQSHFTPRNGGECWTCPLGYKRTAQSITKGKACAKKFFVGPYSKATYQRSVWGCKAGQFHVAKNGGQCMACPKGYNRIQAAGIDTKACKIQSKYKCDGPLKVAKIPPNKNPLANLLGSYKTKVCGKPFKVAKEAAKDLKDYAAVHYHLKQLRLEILLPTKNPNEVRKAVLRKDWNKVWKYLQRLENFKKLKEIAQRTQHKTFTIGLSGDIQAIIGSNIEWGIAINLDGTGGFKPYRTAGFSKGLAIGADGGILIGIWRTKSHDIAGPSQGLAASVGGGVSGGVGVWYSYYQPSTRGQKYIGMTMAVSAGLGVEIGEYNEVWTELL